MMRLRTMTLAGIGLCAVVIASHAAAAQSTDSVRATQDSVDPRAAQPERPTVATHAYTVAPGYAEIEAGIQDAKPSGETAFAAPLVIKLGVLPRLQLELQGGYTRVGSASGEVSGAGDFALALKQRVLDHAPVLADFSIQATIKFPTGAAGVTTGTTDESILLISSRQIGATEIDLNAGYTHRSGDGSAAPTAATLLTASLGRPIRGALGAVAETFAYPGTGGPAGASTGIGFLVGPTLQVRPWLVLDAGAILNIRNLGANAAYAGLTYNAGRIPGLSARRRKS
jgi:outer membrane putative beta-barrel porin/alpha-amylase